MFTKSNDIQETNNSASLINLALSEKYADFYFSNLYNFTKFWITEERKDKVRKGLNSYGVDDADVVRRNDSLCNVWRLSLRG